MTSYALQNFKKCVHNDIICINIFNEILLEYLIFNENYLACFKQYVNKIIIRTIFFGTN